MCIADGTYNGVSTAQVVWKLLKELKNFQGSSGQTDTNRPMDMGEERREKGRCMERVTEIYNTACKTDRQWEFSV